MDEWIISSFINLSFYFTRSFVTEIHQKSSQLLGNSQKPQGSVQPVGYDLHVTLNEMKEGLNMVKVGHACISNFLYE